ncbi:MAG: thiosulfate oxidation carrier complex protein SoxZ [Alphaproteobacteria bacterium]|nr:thiosulfate oxidation carrier complex protein SoxZ [Alphaproteobacteria bacterium]
MDPKVTVRIRAPKTAKAGEVVEIKTLVNHPMESGQRKDADGKTIPRRILNKVVATYGGKQVFAADWHPAISANPYLAFFLKVDAAGTLEMSWTDDDGAVYRTKAEIAIG